ncbi:diacylglycerol/lipid kinase family protein [Methylobacterium oryzisoli]|uniref:diacylglycerol/lipid kinase family protein n=1 Tax=Methylobacterium oryzisoli TaxID=3385502 RepID=UPI00397895C2
MDGVAGEARIRTVALVTNAASGSLAERGLDPGAPPAALAAAGLAVRPEPDPALPLRARLRAAASLPGIDALVVAGGDGTLACAAQALADTGAVLGILPVGTMNLLARDLGIPLDLRAAAAVIAGGRARAIDLGEVNGHVFAINSVLGMPARMARYREAERGRLSLAGLARFLAALLRNLGPSVRIGARLTIGGETRRVRFHTFAAVVGDYREGVGEVLSRGEVDRGRFTLYLLARLPARRLLRLGLGFAAGAWRALPDLDRREATDFTLHTRRPSLRVMNDGEAILLETPLTYRIRPGALRVLVPADGAGA